MKRQWEASRVRVPDMLSAVLVSWSQPQTLRCAQMLVQIMSREPACHKHYVLDWAETRWAQDTVIPCDGRELSFLQYWRLVCETEPRDPVHEQHLQTLLRACFVVALVYDARVKRFVLGGHHLHAVLRCQAPETGDTLRFCEAVRPLCEAFLEQRIEVGPLAESAIDAWAFAARMS